MDRAEQVTLTAVELGSSALGGDVRLELAPRTTVLVGKNGAGKSAILERIGQGFRTVQGIASRPEPERFACELRLQDARSLRYQFVWHPSKGSPNDEVEARLEETCMLNGQLIWRLDDGELLRSDSNNDVGMRKQGLASQERGSTLLDLSTSIRWIGAVISVRANEREEIMVARKGNRIQISTHPLVALTHRFVRWHQTLPDEFEELVELGRRTRLFREISIKRYIDSDGSPTTRDFVSVSIDDTNLGLLSDGTLRAVQIFMELLEPETKLLMIDEPESAAHPGLLARILAEIETYSAERQILLSTQSPQVVSWAQPDAIRLVERNAEVTSVRSFDESTLVRLERYLHDEDTLGDFIYGGGVDGFAE
ncbi:AAA family ATPase [Nannocystaceae bacterium ST9]